MKSKNKALLLTLCAILLVVTSVLGTLAYLTDTEAVQNTFAVGSVGLSLDEAVVDSETGKAVTPAKRTDVGNKDILLIPGRVVDKDPTITVDAGSEASYVRMILTVTYAKAADAVFAENNYQTWFGFDTAKWGSGNLISTTKENGNIIRKFEFRYKDVVSKSDDDTKLDPLFRTVTIPTALDNAKLATMENLTIDVEAHAIQAAGFANADAAWAAFDVQHS